MSYVGKVAIVNLTTGQVEVQNLPQELKATYLGGRSLGTKYWTDLSPSLSVEPLSPENPLIFATGPLTGVSVMGGRYDVITRSPLTGTMTSANSGGQFGGKLKKAGFDLVAFVGRAAAPTYVVIYNGTIELRDASHYWGQLVAASTDGILAEVKSSCDRDRAKATEMNTASVSCIGPAGERGVLFSSTINDKTRSAGRGGVGAVMGSKNLKAVVCGGNTAFPVANLEQFNEVRRSVVEKINTNGVCGLLKEHGTNVLTNVVNNDFMYPTRNFQTAHDPSADEISGERTTSTILKGRKGCQNCIVQCGRLVEVQGRRTEGCEYETNWAFGGDCDIHDLAALTEANRLCNELGIDTISCGATIACGCELVEKGLIPIPGVDQEMHFGMPADKLAKLVTDIGMKDGVLGTQMAEGSYRFAARYGHPELSMSVKKQELPAYDPRGAQGQGLSYATSVRGGCHVYAYLISPEVVLKTVDRFSIDKAALCIAFQDLTAAIDSLGVCLFSSFAIGAPELAAIYEAATGIPMTPDGIFKAGERCWTMQRRINEVNGFTSADDTLPPRLLNEPLTEGPQRTVWRRDELLPAYYQARGWTSDGLVPREKLSELGITF